MAGLQQRWQQHASKISKRHAARLIRGRFQLPPDRLSKQTTKLRPKYQIILKGCSMELLVKEPAWGATAFGSVQSSKNHLLLHPAAAEPLCISDHKGVKLSIPTGTIKPEESTTVVLNFKKCNYRKMRKLVKRNLRQLWEIKSDWQHQSRLTITTWKAQKQYSPPIQKDLIRAKGHQQGSLQLSRGKKASPSISQSQVQMRKTEKTVNSGTSNVIRQTRKNCWNS